MGLPPQQLNLHHFQQPCPLTCSPASSPAAAPNSFCPAKPTPLPLRLTRACTTTPQTLPSALPNSPGAAGNPADEPRPCPEQAGSRGSLPFGVPPRSILAVAVAIACAVARRLEHLPCLLQCRQSLTFLAPLALLLFGRDGSHPASSRGTAARCRG